jgi:hypothetical protein
MSTRMVESAPSVLLMPGTLPREAPVREALLADAPDAGAGACARWLAQATVTSLDDLTWTDCERARVARGAADGRTGFATPMNFVLALTDLTGTDPDTLVLDVSTSRALCADADTHLAPEGVRCHYEGPGLWRVSLAEPIEVACERPIWLAGEPIRPLLPRGRDARRVERWMNELQMLLHDHPGNRARTARGLPAVNGVWLWGFDGLPPAPAVEVVTGFTRALAAGDVAGWQRAWGTIAERLAAADEVILGDARPRLRLTPGRPGLFARLGARWRRPDLAATLGRLATLARASDA